MSKSLRLAVAFLAFALMAQAVAAQYYYPPPSPYPPPYPPPPYAYPPPQQPYPAHGAGESGQCREYSRTAIIGGEKQEIYGHACRQPDGKWHVID